MLLLCSSLCFFLWVGFVLQASKTVVLFLCSLLQSSLQILGQTHGLLEILSKVVSWFREWPGQVAPWPPLAWGQAGTSSSCTSLYYLPSSEFRNPGRFAAEILNPPEAPIISSSTLQYLPSGEFRNSRRIAAEILEQLGPPISGNSKCQILESKAWARPKLGTPEASKQLCFFWGAIYKESSFPLLL